MQVPFRQYSDVSGNGFYKRKKLSSFPGHRRTDVNKRHKQVNKLRSVSIRYYQIKHCIDALRSLVSLFS